MIKSSAESSTRTSQKSASASASFSTVEVFKARSAGSTGRQSSLLADAAKDTPNRKHARAGRNKNSRREHLISYCLTSSRIRLGRIKPRGLPLSTSRRKLIADCNAGLLG